MCQYYNKISYKYTKLTFLNALLLETVYARKSNVCGENECNGKLVVLPLPV